MTGSDRDMRRQGFSDPEIEKALDWLRDHARDMGMAAKRARSAGHMLKHLEAVLAKASGEKSAEARKTDARASERYVEAINEDAEAFGEYERLKALREAAALKIEAWRTECSNFRSMKI